MSELISIFELTPEEFRKRIRVQSERDSAKEFLVDLRSELQLEIDKIERYFNTLLSKSIGLLTLSGLVALFSVVNLPANQSVSILDIFFKFILPYLILAVLFFMKATLIPTTLKQSFTTIKSTNNEFDVTVLFLEVKALFDYWKHLKQGIDSTTKNLRITTALVFSFLSTATVHAYFIYFNILPTNYLFEFEVTINVIILCTSYFLSHKRIRIIQYELDYKKFEDPLLNSTNTMTHEQQVQIKATEDALKGEYVNYTQISHTENEVTLDFISMIAPNGIFPANANLKQRVIVSPAHFKSMIVAMGNVLRVHEEKFGAIKASEASVTPIGFSENKK